MLQLGSVARLGSLLDGISLGQSVTGTTDGKKTDLKFTENNNAMPYGLASVTGQFAGDKVDLKVDRSMQNNDVLLHLKSQGKSLPVDLNVSILGATSGLRGYTEKGTLDGHQLDLTYDSSQDKVTGTIDGQQYNLAGTVTTPHAPIPWQGGTADAQVHLAGGLGQKGTADLSTTEHFVKTPNDFGPRLTSEDVSGIIASVKISEHQG